MQQPPEEGEALRLLHRLAVMGVAHGVLGPSEGREKIIEQALEGLPAHLQKPAGAFVTLKRNGRTVRRSL